jgi:hypothetical protein
LEAAKEVVVLVAEGGGVGSAAAQEEMTVGHLAAEYLEVGSMEAVELGEASVEGAKEVAALAGAVLGAEVMVEEGMEVAAARAAMVEEGLGEVVREGVVSEEEEKAAVVMVEAEVVDLAAAAATAAAVAATVATVAEAATAVLAVTAAASAAVAMGVALTATAAVAAANSVVEVPAEVGSATEEAGAGMAKGEGNSGLGDLGEEEVVARVVAWAAAVAWAAVVTEAACCPWNMRGRPSCRP